MGKYVNGFNRFYARTTSNYMYVTAGLTLFCRFHNDFQLPEHHPNSQEIHLVDPDFKMQAISDELYALEADKNRYRGANCSYGNFIQGFKFRPASMDATEHGIYGLLDVHAKCTDGISIMAGPRPRVGEPGEKATWTDYVMCAPSFAVCGGIFKAVKQMPNQMLSAQFFCCPLPIDEFIDWMGMPMSISKPPPREVPQNPQMPQKWAGFYGGLAGAGKIAK